MGKISIQEFNIRYFMIPLDTGQTFSRLDITREETPKEKISSELCQVLMGPT
jgi:hypothetical protein